jgi:hypothetical protein
MNCWPKKSLEEMDSPDEHRQAPASSLGRPGRQLRLNRARPGFLGIQLGIRKPILFELALDSGRRTPVAGFF